MKNVDWLLANGKPLSHNSGIVLFDGVCNLCNGWVKFLFSKNPSGSLYYTSLQSETAIQLLQNAPNFRNDLQSIVYIENSSFFFQSTAILRMLRHLKFPWNQLYIFTIIPSFFRDAIYKLIANNRYRTFGKLDYCSLPTKKYLNHFLD